jgi:hypothetical protein
MFFTSFSNSQSKTVVIEVIYVRIDDGSENEPVGCGCGNTGYVQANLEHARRIVDELRVRMSAALVVGNPVLTDKEDIIITIECPLGESGATLELLRREVATMRQKRLILSV